jgi:hypothetical protein
MTDNPHVQIGCVANLLAPVAAWATESYKAFVPNGHGRQYGVLYRKDLAPPPEVWEIRRLVVEANNLQAYPTEPMFQDYCGFITEGGAIHQHQDPDHNGRQHVRFNVMVSKPEAGGMPVQDGEEMAVNEGDVWRCNASRVRHWCTTVQGPKPRIVLSYGFLL